MKQLGFTLVEVLVALSVFAVGMLGAGLLLARGLHEAANEEVRMVIQQALHDEHERLRGALTQGPSSFHRVLRRLAADQHHPEPSESPRPRLRLLWAKDRNDRDLLATSPDHWLPPYRLLIEADYRDPRIQRRASHALVLTPPPHP